MDQAFATQRFLLASLLIMAGVAISGGTLAYNRGSTFDVIILWGFIAVVGLVGLSLVTSLCLCVIASAVMGEIGRHQFQVIWVYTAIMIQIVLALLSSYFVYRFLDISNLFQGNHFYARATLYCAPYLSAYLAIEILHADPEPIAAEAEYWVLRGASRRTERVFLVLGILISFVIGWFVPWPGNWWIVATVPGLPITMLIYQYLPGQKRMRDIEKLRKWS